MNDFLVKANLYPVMLRCAKDGVTFPSYLGGHVNDIPEEFNEEFWNSYLDNKVWYWDVDAEISAIDDGELLQDNIWVISIGEPEYHEMFLELND